MMLATVGPFLLVLPAVSGMMPLVAVIVRVVAGLVAPTALVMTPRMVLTMAPAVSGMVPLVTLVAPVVAHTFPAPVMFTTEAVGLAPTSVAELVTAAPAVAAEVMTAVAAPMVFATEALAPAGMVTAAEAAVMGFEASTMTSSGETAVTMTASSREASAVVAASPTRETAAMTSAVTASRAAAASAMTTPSAGTSSERRMHDRHYEQQSCQHCRYKARMLHLFLFDCERAGPLAKASPQAYTCRTASTRRQEQTCLFTTFIDLLQEKRSHSQD
jgi:hypothetical protein